jgi:hypothetical protein
MMRAMCDALNMNTKRLERVSGLVEQMDMMETRLPQPTTSSTCDSIHAFPSYDGIDAEKYVEWEIKIDCCRRFETGGSLGRRVKCRCVPQPRWVGARRSAKGGRKGSRSERGRWKSRSLRVRPAPRSGALAVGGYKRSTREGASGLTRAPVPSSSLRGQPSVRGPWSFLL